MSNWIWLFMIQASDSEFRELWFVSAVFVVSEEFWLSGFKFTKNIVGVETGSEMLEEFKAFLIFE